MTAHDIDRLTQGPAEGSSTGSPIQVGNADSIMTTCHHDGLIISGFLRDLGHAGKRIVAYGAGIALLQAHAVAPLSFDYLVDDTPGLAGREVLGTQVFPSARLRSERRDDLIIIIFANTPRAVLSMAQHLNSMGLVWGEHYLDCSVLQYETMASRMRGALGLRPNYELFWRIRLLSLYSTVQSLSTIAGTWLFVQLLEHLSCQGSVAECGVYNGGNALISLLSSNAACQREYHLLDSFEGFPQFSKADPACRQTEFRDVDVPYIRDVFRNFKNVNIHKGYFTNTLPAMAGEQFAIAYLDCDLYEPTLELCEFFYPRLSDGGCLLIHDYWTPDNDPPHTRIFRGVKKAVQEFLGQDTSRLVVFPETTHAVLFR